MQVDFIVAGGSRVGMGHVMRSATLAAAAGRRGWRVRVLLEGDSVARERWIDVSGADSVLASTAWNDRRCAPLTVLDYPDRKDAWLDRLEGAPTCSIVLDDLRSISRATLSVCPALHHAGLALSPGRRRARLLAGPHYSILGEAHRSTPRRPLSGRDRLLLSMGGADPHRVTPRIAPILEGALERRTPGRDGRVGLRSRDVVLGPAFRDPGERVARALEATGWQVHHGLTPTGMADLMSSARLAVIGFGTSLAELAWHGTPHLSVTHHLADVPWARRLEARGIGIHLGHAADLDAERISDRLDRVLSHDAWQHESASRAFDALEGGLGCDRILDRMEALTIQQPEAERSAGEARMHPPATP